MPASPRALFLTNARLALGPIDPQIDTSSLGPLYLGSFDKTRFSMITPDIKAILDARPHTTSVVLFGIEASTPLPPF